MAKANEYVVDALEDIVVQADEAPIEPTEGRAVLRALNDMMAMWASQGVNLGYTDVDDLGQEVTVPDGAKLGIKAHLAIFVAPKYDVAISAELQRKADIGWDAILNLAIDTNESEYPSTLPQGSGNSEPGYLTDTFYPDSEGNILEETGGAIALEDDTEASS